MRLSSGAGGSVDKSMPFHYASLVTFDWDDAKEKANLAKHGVDFCTAHEAFVDPKRVRVQDISHSQAEARQWCVGFDGRGLLTVRYTVRSGVIRVIGAGYWRKGKKLYEEANQIH